MISCGEKPRVYFSNMRTDSKPVRVFKNAAVVGARNTVDWDAAMQWCGKRCQSNQMWHIFQISKSRKKPFGLHRLEAFKNSKDGIYNRILTVLNVLFSFSCHPLFPISSKNGRRFHPWRCVGCCKRWLPVLFHASQCWLCWGFCLREFPMVVLGQKHSEEL